MSELSGSQHAILLRLKMRRPLSAPALAGHLGMTGMGVRQHLNALLAGGYVAQADLQAPPRTRGRPVRPWQLTGKGHAQFPDAHTDVAITLIASVRQAFGESGMEVMVQRWGEQQLDRYRAMLGEAALTFDNADFPARLEALARLRTEDGYLCEVKALGGGAGEAWLLIENHCPIRAAATACPSYCGAELELFRALLGADIGADIGAGKDADPLAGPEVTVERVNHVLTGARRCAYRVTRVGVGK